MTSPQPAPARSAPRLLWVIIACAVIGVAVAAAAIALVQSSRIGSLSASLGSAQKADASLSAEVAALNARQDAISQAEQTRQSAETADLGVCESQTTETLDNYSPPVTVVTSVSLAAPTLTSGVASCPFGSFVPVSPATAPGG